MCYNTPISSPRGTPINPPRPSTPESNPLEHKKQVYVHGGNIHNYEKDGALKGHELFCKFVSTGETTVVDACNPETCNGFVFGDATDPNGVRVKDVFTAIRDAWGEEPTLAHATDITYKPKRIQDHTFADGIRAFCVELLIKWDGLDHWKEIFIPLVVETQK